MCKARMDTLGNATFMRAVYTQGHSTTPNVMATVNLSAAPIDITIKRYDEPFMQDNYTAGFPPKITFSDAFTHLLRTLGKGASPKQMTFRRPLHPCASEDLFQFELYNQSEVAVASLGLASAELCEGFITQHVGMKMCPEPHCWGSMRVSGRS